MFLVSIDRAAAWEEVPQLAVFMARHVSTVNCFADRHKREMSLYDNSKSNKTHCFCL